MSGAQGVQVESVDLPELVQPGEQVTARIDMTNTSNFINPFNANRCSEGNNYGLLTEAVLVAPDGEEFVGDTVCAKQHDIAVSYETTSEVTFTVPEEDGTHRYDAYVRMAETGEESSRVSESINVYQNEEDAPEEAEDTGGDSEGVWPGGDDPGTPGSSQLRLVLGVVVIVAIFYASGNLFDIGIGYGGKA